MEPRHRRGDSLGAPAGTLGESLSRSASAYRYAVPFVAALLLAASSAGAQRVPSAREALFGQDKVKHFFIAGFVESVAFAGLRAVGTNRRSALGGAVAAAGAASLGRELHDRRTKGAFSLPDLVWDALGAGAAFLVLAKTQK